MPNAKSMESAPILCVLTVKEAGEWLEQSASKYDDLLNKGLTPQEQAKQAIELSNQLLIVQRNAMADARAAEKLYKDAPLGEFDAWKTTLAENTGKSGDKLYEAIIQQAKDQLKSKACFVAGTLVHTKEGLRPIEEIKVGDYVLSKPENGEGELTYQRVTRTFVHENQEVWALRYDTQRDPVLGWVNPVGGWLVATKDHPIWQVYAYSSLIPSHVKPSKPSRRWMSVYEHYEETSEGYGGGGLLLANGAIVEVDRVYPLVQNEEGLADTGVMFDENSDDVDSCHSALYFSNGEPKWVMDENGPGIKSFYVSNTRWEDNEFTCTQAELDAAEPDSITDLFMRRPFLRTVYNLEVENTHTYFVGEHGVWVHNTCEDTILKDYLEAQAKQKLSVTCTINGVGLD